MYHFPEPLVMNRFTRQHSRMKNSINGIPVNPAASRALALLTAMIIPRFV